VCIVITGIVGDLLDLSLERQGRGVAITPAPTDLAAICREVLEEVELNGREPIRFYAPASVHGTWDGARLAQAISNLVYNALKHGAADQPVSLRVRGDDGHAFVQVHNGGAIPGDVLPTLFEPFSARSESTRGRDGLGLGLFIARAITTAHRGDLRVVTNEAEGTTFTIALPRG
jgi:signal transduction histidine kinase